MLKKVLRADLVFKSGVCRKLEFKLLASFWKRHRCGLGQYRREYDWEVSPPLPSRNICSFYLQISHSRGLYPGLHSKYTLMEEAHVFSLSLPL